MIRIKDKDLLAKQMINEMEGNFLSLAYTYDLSSIEQIELLNQIEITLSDRFSEIQTEIETKEDLVYCLSCGKYYKKDECELTYFDNYYEKSCLLLANSQIKSNIVELEEEFCYCPNEHLIYRTYNKGKEVTEKEIAEKVTDLMPAD